VSAEDQLADYREQTPEVKSYFEGLHSREVVLKVEKLGKVFGEGAGATEALQDVSFNVHHREFVSIVGPSGCGKSTLIRILAGLETSTSGSAMLDGEEIRGPGSGRGMVFQSYTLFPWRTVAGNVTFGPEMMGKSSDEVEQEAEKWLEMVGLADFKNHYPHQLSGGMKQRVGIARALANRPRILLMDEPFGALDAQTRALMQAYLLQIWRHVDVTILFITHDLDEAIYLSDRILVLEANPGRIEEFVEIPLERPRKPDQFLDPRFLAVRHRLDVLIHGEFPEEADELSFIGGVDRFAVGDAD
jgi:NitT/TauT family transport system ATP-binding protein